MASANLTTIFAHIDSNWSLYKQRLAESVALQSVSGLPENRSIVQDQIQVFADMIETLGGSYELIDIGTETLPDGTIIPIPKPCFGILGTDPTKKTILIYGHLDVQPASLSDGWDTDPFVLTEVPGRDGVLYGRGTTDDKGPCLAWMNAIEAHGATGVDMPVNIKFILEGMEETGAGSLETETVAPFVTDVDCVCISDNYWLGKTKPCLTYGLRGVTYFFVTVNGAAKDLHSGVYGGSVHEAMSDLIYIMNGLVDVDGNILIPGINNDVAELTPEEAALYTDIEFAVDEFKADIGTNELLYPTKEEILQHRWRFPSLSLHGIQGASSDMSEKTVIPANVVGKFSIRIVPDMSVSDVKDKVKQHVANLWAERGSPNDMTCEMTTGADWWLSKFDSPHYNAAKRATIIVHKVVPDFIREGGSIPVTLTLQEASGQSTLLFPFGRSDDGAHSQNEKFDKSNYISGMKVAAAYFEEVSKLPSSTA